MTTGEQDRPAFPGAYNMGTAVRFPFEGVERRGVVAGATATQKDKRPMLLVSYVDGAEETTLWVPREMVRRIPPPFRVRVRAWVKSFLFGEK